MYRAVLSIASLIYLGPVLVYNVIDLVENIPEPFNAYAGIFIFFTLILIGTVGLYKIMIKPIL